MHQESLARKKESSVGLYTCETLFDCGYLFCYECRVNQAPKVPYLALYWSHKVSKAFFGVTFVMANRKYHLHMELYGKVLCMK